MWVCKEWQHPCFSFWFVFFLGVYVISLSFGYFVGFKLLLCSFEFDYKVVWDKRGEGCITQKARQELSKEIPFLTTTIQFDRGSQQRAHRDQAITAVDRVMGCIYIWNTLGYIDIFLPYKEKYTLYFIQLLAKYSHFKFLLIHTMWVILHSLVAHPIVPPYFYKPQARPDLAHWLLFNPIRDVGESWHQEICLQSPYFTTTSGRIHRVDDYIKLCTR